MRLRDFFGCDGVERGNKIAHSRTVSLNHPLNLDIFTLDTFPIVNIRKPVTVTFSTTLNSKKAHLAVATNNGGSIFTDVVMDGFEIDVLAKLEKKKRSKIEKKNKLAVTPG